MHTPLSIYPDMVFVWFLHLSEKSLMPYLEENEKHQVSTYPVTVDTVRAGQSMHIAFKDLFGGKV